MLKFLIALVAFSPLANAVTLDCTSTDRFVRSWDGEYSEEKISVKYVLTQNPDMGWEVVMADLKGNVGSFQHVYEVGKAPFLFTNAKERGYNARASKSLGETFEITYSAVFSNLNELPSGTKFKASISIGGYEELGHPVTLWTDTSECVKR